MSVAALYDGRTTHVRATPQRRFSYRVFQVLLDVDRIAEATRSLRAFSYNAPNLVSFFDKDHGDRSGRPLRAWAEAAFARVGVTLDGGPIRLLCFPRVLGYAFNPVSLFYGFGPDGRMRGVLYEVNNTFGESHTYAAPAGEAGVTHQEAEKSFHVSPFLDVRGRYRFLVNAPGERLFLRVANEHDGATEHYATLIARRAPLTDAALIKACARLPLMTLQVVAGIHWEAAKIWLGGVKYRRKPAPPSRAISHATLEPQRAASAADQSWT